MALEPFFFFSYARKNGGDELDRFVRKLESAVQQYVAVEGSVSFFDKNDIELGASWPRELEDALRGAQVLVTLYSPAYFESEYCGKEWAAFASRFNVEATKGDEAPVFPVLWVPMGNKDLPLAVQHIPIHARGFRRGLPEARALSPKRAAARDGVRELRECPSHLRRLWGRLNTLPLHIMLDRSTGDDVRLSDVYTDLDVTDRVGLRDGSPGAQKLTPDLLQPSIELDERYLAARFRHWRELWQGEDDPPFEPIQLSALEAVAGVARLVLLGPPGSGKSSFAKHLALALAGQLLGEESSNLRRLNGEREATSLPDTERAWPHGALVPVFVELSDFVRSDAFPAVGKGEVEHLLAYLAKREGDTAVSSIKEKFAERSGSGGAILILDGLDETPGDEDVRVRLKGVVDAFARAYPRCRMLVTSRPYAYEEDAPWRLDGSGFHQTELAPLSKESVASFVRGWYQLLLDRGKLVEAQRERLEAALLSDIDSDEGYRSLAARPLMLTVMADVAASQGGLLGGGKVELYERSAELLLDKWNRAREVPGAKSATEKLGLSVQHMRQALDELAFEVHRESGGREGPAGIHVGRVWEALDRHRHGEAIKLREATDFLNERAGILLGEARDLYTFPHRSYQEYLAACHALRDDFPYALVGVVRGDVALWREVFQFAASKAAAASPFMVWNLLETLVPEPPPEEVQAADERFLLALLTAEAVAENHLLERLQAQDKPKLERVRDWLTRMLQVGALSSAERAEAGRILSAIGDPRKGVGLNAKRLPDIDWVEISAGAFLMGDEKNEIRLPSYRLSRYPVTNAQYQAFVAAGGYGEDRFWSKEGWAWRKDQGVVGAEDYEGTLSNHPRVGVSWYEADAFCRWLGAQVPYDVRLPREVEWEKGARGTDGREFPWGDGFDAARLNANATGIGRTTAVGAFPAGKSPYELMDMSGNVWEWCEDVDEEEPRARVLRGGAFVNLVQDYRCAYRSQYYPHLRYFDIGFRVWSSVSSEL